MLPDAAVGDPAAVQRLIAAVGRRRWLEQMAWATAAGGTAAALLVVVAHLTGGGALPAFARNGTAFVVAALTAGWTRRWRNPAASARTIERVHPPCRNLVITAEELRRHPERASPAVTARVLADASRITSGLRAGTIVPPWRALAALGAALAVGFVPAPAARDALRRALDPVSSSITPGAEPAPDFRVVVDPPAYSGRKSVSMNAPERIAALEGSRIRFEVPDGWRVRFGEARPSLQAIALASGYFAIEREAGGGQPLLVPLSVNPDRAPSVRIEAPAKDLLLPDGTRSIPVKVSASDDLALARLELRYTKVSGTGEQFEFVEGVLPVTLQRSTERDWTADAQLALASLKLGPGDSLVYRAVARDRRPGDAGLAASDTYFVEIAGPGQVALEGVEMPPELERYAMSQQMIVVKIERLRTREPKMTPEALTEEAASLAAEQRTVRANFVFLLGGHVEDEFEEAEQSHEIQEGRLENTARKDINDAISQMTRAEQGLTARNTSAALPPARAAVESLQRAFGRSRYLLRSLAVSSRVDPSRRLTGDLEGAGEWRRSESDPSVREGDDARRLLNELIDVSASAPSGSAPDVARIRQLAESALAIDPASPLWQEIARRLLDAKDTDALREVIARLSPEALHGLVGRTPLSREASALERAFTSERRR